MLANARLVLHCPWRRLVLLLVFLPQASPAFTRRLRARRASALAPVLAVFLNVAAVSLSTARTKAITALGSPLSSPPLLSRLFSHCCLNKGIRLNLEALDDVKVGVGIGDGIDELVEEVVVEAEHQLLHVVDLQLLHLQLHQLVVLAVATGQLNRAGEVQRVVKEDHLELDDGRIARSLCCPSLLVGSRSLGLLVLVNFEAEDLMVRNLIRASVVLVRIQGPRVVHIVKDTKVPNLALEGVVILVAIVCYPQLIKLLREHREGVVLRVDADELDLLDVHFHGHHVCGVVEAGCPVRALVEAAKAVSPVGPSVLATGLTVILRLLRARNARATRRVSLSWLLLSSSTWLCRA